MVYLYISPEKEKRAEAIIAKNGGGDARGVEVAAFNKAKANLKEGGDLKRAVYELLGGAGREVTEEQAQEHEKEEEERSRRRRRT